MKTIVVLALASFAWGACAQAQEAPTGDAARGKQIYLADGCSYCHGTVGQGGGGRAAGFRLHQDLGMPGDVFAEMRRREPGIEIIGPAGGMADQDGDGLPAVEVLDGVLRRRRCRRQRCEERKRRSRRSPPTGFSDHFRMPMVLRSGGGGKAWM